MTVRKLLIREENGLETRVEYDGMAAALKGAVNGVAELDSGGRVPSEQLPSYVDDVIEVADFASLPTTGESGKIYVTLYDRLTWRWSGSVYTEISASLALGETPATAYRGDRGATAYTHSQATGNPHGTTPDDIGAFAKVFVLGGINFHDFDTPGVYEIRGNSWANGWAGLTGTQGVALLQMHDADGRRFLVAGDGKYGGLMLKFQASEIPGDHWSPWFQVWDSGCLPAGAVGKAVLAAATAAAGRTAINAAEKPGQTDKSGNWTLDADTPMGVRQTSSGTLTLPAASATYAAKSYVITASTNVTLTIAGTFCYLDSPASASYWYDTTSSTKAFVMNGTHGSGERKRIELWCDGVEWLVKC